jgi:protein-arginine kinase activator protein McsA
MMLHLSRRMKNSAGKTASGIKELNEPTMLRQNIGHLSAAKQSARDAQVGRTCEKCSARLSRFTQETNDLCWSCTYTHKPTQEKKPTCPATRSPR